VIWDGISIGKAMQTSASMLCAFIDVISSRTILLMGCMLGRLAVLWVPLWAKFATSDPGTTVTPLHMASGLVVSQRSLSVI
jgi:hypothetical protein